MERSAWVSRILTFSCVDGPGNRLVVFLQGCNFNCLNCHNPHTINHCDHCAECVEHCPSDALAVSKDGKVEWDESRCTQCDKCIEVCPSSSSPKITQMSVSDVLGIVEKHAPFLSGITMSGGEATLQLPFIRELFSQIKGDQRFKHLTCFVDSNGYLSTQGWETLAPNLDGVMIDLKAWQDETHQWLVGRDNHRVVKSIQWLAEHGKLHELRLLHIPKKSDLDIEIDALAKFIASLPVQVPIRINAFQHHGVVGQALTWQKCTKQQVEEFASQLSLRLDNKMTLPTVYT